jgi:hypothetical protein
MDIIGFSKPGTKTQTQFQMITSINEIVKKWIKMKKIASRNYLINQTGDGMVIGFKEKRRHPFDLAIHIQKTLKKKKSEIKIRMGLNTGDVLIINNVKNLPDFCGNGIIMAQRIMDFGDTNHILASEDFANNIEKFTADEDVNIKKLEGGYFTKHDEEIILCNIFGDEFGNPQPPKTKNNVKKQTKAEKFKIIKDPTKVLEYATTLIQKMTVKSLRTIWCIKYPEGQLDDYFSLLNKVTCDRKLKLTRLVNLNHDDTKEQLQAHLKRKEVIETIKLGRYRITKTTHEGFEVLITDEPPVALFILPSVGDIAQNGDLGLIIEDRSFVERLIPWYDKLFQKEAKTQELKLKKDLSITKSNQHIKNWLASKSKKKPKLRSRHDDILYYR